MKTHIPHPRLAAQIGLCLLAALSGTLAAHAETFPVTSLADSGPGSLREAVALANANPGPDTVDLTGVTGTISLTSGALLLTEAAEFHGPGKDQLSIDGNYTGRILLGMQGKYPWAATFVDIVVTGVTFYRAYDINEYYGGAIVGANVTATDCDFLSCHGGEGSAIYAGNISLTRCNFFRCGGRFAVASTRSTVAVGCRFEANESTWAVLGEFWNEPTLDLTGCTFIGNRFGSGGAGISGGGSLRLRGCVLQDNMVSMDFWGPISAVNSVFVTGTTTGDSFHMVASADFEIPREFINCTFINRWSTWYSDYAPILDYGSKGEWTFGNCIFRGTGPQLVSISDSSLKLTTANCNWENPLEESMVKLDYYGFRWNDGLDLTDFGGHTFGDPLFVDVANDDFRLLPGSPCIDAGDDGLIPDGVTGDFLGNARISGAQVDMGAYETDTTPPVITTPGNLAVTATSGAGAVVTFAASAADDVDGPVAVTCTPASGGTFAPGVTTVTCTATDAAGNTATSSFTVTVTYGWSGVLQPVNADGSSVFKAGATVPVRFQLAGASAGIATVAARLTYAKVSNSVPGPVNEADASGNASTGNLFQYDAASGQYRFNWSTKGLGSGSYRVWIDLGDGVVRTVDVALR